MPSTHRSPHLAADRGAPLRLLAAVCALLLAVGSSACSDDSKARRVAELTATLEAYESAFPLYIEGRYQERRQTSDFLELTRLRIWDDGARYRYEFETTRDHEPPKADLEYSKRAAYDGVLSMESQFPGTMDVVRGRRQAGLNAPHPFALLFGLRANRAQLYRDVRLGEVTEFWKEHSADLDTHSFVVTETGFEIVNERGDVVTIEVGEIDGVTVPTAIEKRFHRGARERIVPSEWDSRAIRFGLPMPRRIDLMTWDERGKRSVRGILRLDTIESKPLPRSVFTYPPHEILKVRVLGEDEVFRDDVAATLARLRGR